MNMSHDVTELTDEQVDRLFEHKAVARYLKKEVKFTGSRRDAILNACCVTSRNGKLTIEDLDCTVFSYEWVPSLRRWQ